MVSPRPALELAAHYVPAPEGVGGDFFLAAEGPRGSTVLVVGDVVGKGVTAARRAVFVRTSLVTSAPFEDDPARLLRLANAALIDRAGTSMDYVTAVCVVHRPADRDAGVGDRGASAAAAARRRSPLDAVGAGLPLGLEIELEVASSSAPLARTMAYCSTRTGSSTRATGPRRRFGEERLQSLVAA